MATAIIARCIIVENSLPVLTLLEYQYGFLCLVYLRHSPPIADYIREREALRAIVRSVLAVIIYAIEYPGPAGFILLLALLIRVRQKRKQPKPRDNLGISESQASI